MIIGIISIYLDLFVLNISNYYIDNSIIFPMFTIVFFISAIHFKVSILKLLIIYLLYSSVLGIFYLPLLIIFIDITFLNKSYYSSIIISLLLYDFYFYLFLQLNNVFFLVNKIIITIPINVLYSYIIYNLFIVLKNKNNKYKLVYEKKKKRVKKTSPKKITI